MRHSYLSFSVGSAAVLAGIAMIFSLSTVAFAQSDAALEATIREAILSDPRSADMNAAEFDAMIAALVEEAAMQGITPDDISWRPQEEGLWGGGPAEGAESCAYPAFLCALNEAFGFNDSSPVMPLLFAITSAVLLFTIGSILLHHHGHHPFAGNLQKQD